MHLGVRELAAAISAVALIFCCSCEKHHAGEDPEVQKEALGNENPAAASKSEPAESATPKPTPVQFFPETTPPP